MDVEARREYCWKYFALHAEQRLRVFQFYLSVSLALAAGLLAFARDPDNVSNGWPLGLLIALVSFVFAQLDKRSVELIKHAESALIHLEEADALDDVNGAPHPLSLFERERHDTKTRRKIPAMEFFATPWSYSRSFRVLYLTLGWGGFVTSCLLAYRLIV